MNTSIYHPKVISFSLELQYSLDYPVVTTRYKQEQIKSTSTWSTATDPEKTYLCPLRLK